MPEPLTTTTTTAAQPNRPEPHQVRPVAGGTVPSRTGGLLGLIRKLIDYGKNLANTLQEHVAATSVANLHTEFGSTNLMVILARILHGLGRAAALQTRLINHVPHKEKTPAAAIAPSQRPPRAAPPAAKPVAQSADGTDLQIPTAEEIAAEIRRRPIGAVLADICRDLGILPCNPLWRELSVAIIHNGGNLAGVLKDMFTRMRNRPRSIDRFASFITPPMPPGWRPPPRPQFAEAFGTGPP